MTFWKRLFCRHRDMRFVRNIELVELDVPMSLWECQNCKKLLFREGAHIKGDLWIAKR